MASRPKEQRLRAVLEKLAAKELGEGAEPIDLIVQRVANGQTVTAFAKEVAKAMGEEASRSWISWVCNRITPDAKARIAAARKDAAMVLAEEALAISDEPAKSTTDVQRNRLRADVRQNLAKAFDRETFGERASTTVHLSIGQLHLDALRRRVISDAQRKGEIPEASFEVLPATGGVPLALTPGRAAEEKEGSIAPQRSAAE
jgi:cell division septum initiation protein DivIVA